MGIATMDLSKDSFVHAKGAFYVFARNGEKYKQCIDDSLEGVLSSTKFTEEDDMAIFGVSTRVIRERFGDNLIVATGGLKSTNLRGWTVHEDDEFCYDLAWVREVDLVIATKDNTLFGVNAPLIANFIRRYFMHTAKLSGTFHLKMQVKDEVEDVYFAGSAIETCEETPDEQAKRHVDTLYDAMSGFGNLLRRLAEDED